MDQWYVIFTNPQLERVVARQLKNYEPYTPFFKTSRGTIAPLFPRYIFIPQQSCWGPICTTPGVRALLMAGDHPAAVAGKVIAEWKAKERGGLVQLPPPPRFRIGERLTILRGSLQYRTVIYAGMSGRDRERVLIEMLGGQVTLIVPTADLAPGFRPRPHTNRLRFQRETLKRENSARAAASAGARYA